MSAVDESRRQLLASRALILADLASIDGALRALDHHRDYSARPVRRVGGGSADYALRALAARAPAACTVQEVLEGMKSLGWNAEVARPAEVARNALFRAERAGEVRRVSRGRYAVVSKEEA